MKVPEFSALVWWWVWLFAAPAHKRCRKVRQHKESTSRRRKLISESIFKSCSNWTLLSVLTFHTAVNRRYRSMTFTSDLMRMKQHAQIPSQLEICHVPAVRHKLSLTLRCTKPPLETALKAFKETCRATCTYADMEIHKTCRRGSRFFFFF